MDDRCAIPGCRASVGIVYLSHGICTRHWNELMDEDQPAGALAHALGIPVAEATTKETDMAEKTKKNKTAKAKKEKAPNEATRVFAIRVTDQELAAIHKAAGPRNATRFIRQVAAAFANEDEGAFRAVIKEAREARA